MKDVTNLVDDNMFERTKNYLISRKDGQGGFLRSDQALDTFGRAPEDITNAYIVWSLTSSGYTDLDEEVQHLIDVAEE